jgi:hypothetical protein
MFLGLEVPLEAGWFFCGMNNFCNYADWGDADFRRYRSVQPGDYPKWFRNWDAGEDGETANTRWNRFRVDRFTQAIGRYSDVLDLLRHARPAISAGARNELKYLVAKTESLVSHLRTCCALMEGWLAHDAALCAKRRNDREATIARFDDCEAHYRRAAELAVETATKIATGADDPTDRHILFRYNVGYLLTTREFHKWIRNAANYHRGLPYWEPVDWTIIDPLGVI